MKFGYNIEYTKSKIMDELLRKLKFNSILTFILGILSLSWIVLDYFVFKEVLKQENVKFGFDWVLIIISAIAIIAFHISVFITLYYTLRIRLRLKDRKITEVNENSKEI